VRQAIEDLADYDDLKITNYLKVELASIIGSKTLESISLHDPQRAKELYSAVRSISTPGFATNPDNYGALDVLSWTTIAMLKNKVFDEKEKLNAQAALLNLFDISENEGVSKQHYEDFVGRKLMLAELMDDDFFIGLIICSIRKRRLYHRLLY
jgi:hypothetical protein